LAPAEYARNVLGWADANSTEVNTATTHPVVLEMPEVSLTQLGGTMRLGKRRTVFVKPDCLTRAPCLFLVQLGLFLFTWFVSPQASCMAASKRSRSGTGTVMK
jgi:hypothetical protein